MTRENLDGEVSGVAAMGFEWIQKPLGWRERYWKLLELRMRAAWRLMTWTIGFLMGTRNLADWWQPGPLVPPLPAEGSDSVGWRLPLRAAVARRR